MDREITEIMRLARALTATGKYHAFVDYSGHVESLSMRVLPADTEYVAGKPQTRMIWADVYLTHPKAVQMLRNMAEEMGVLLRDATVGDESAEEWIRVQLPSYLQRQAQ